MCASSAVLGRRGGSGDAGRDRRQHHARPRLAPWFSSRIQSVIQNSLTVAQIYFNEQSALIRSEIAAMAFDVSRAKPLFDSDRERFKQFLSNQARVPWLPLTLMVDSDLKVIEKAEIEGVGDIAPSAAPGALAGVGDAEPQVAMFLESRSVAAVIKLRGYDDAYLYVARRSMRG
jgi:two-component system nitrogen regulation sensor histidine kinase NtrY